MPIGYGIAKYTLQTFFKWKFHVKFIWMLTSCVKNTLRNVLYVMNLLQVVDRGKGVSSKNTLWYFDVNDEKFWYLKLLHEFVNGCLFSFFCYGPSDKFYNIFKMLRLNFAHLSYTYMDFLMIRENTVLIYFDYVNELLIMDVACMPRIAQWLLPT